MKFRMTSIVFFNIINNSQVFYLGSTFLTKQSIRFISYYLVRTHSLVLLDESGYLWKTRVLKLLYGKLLYPLDM